MRSRFFARAVEKERKRFLAQIKRALDEIDPNAAVPTRRLTPLERQVLEGLRRRWGARDDCSLMVDMLPWCCRAGNDAWPDPCPWHPQRLTADDDPGGAA